MKLRVIVSSLLAAIGVVASGMRGSADITALPVYTIVDLGTLGGPFSEGQAINDAGIAVGDADVLSGYSHGFRYPGSLPILDLGGLVGEFSYAADINSGGVIVGNASPGVPGTRLVIWNNGPATVPAPFAALNSSGQAINDANVIVGNYTSAVPTSRLRAMMHTLGTSSFIDIGALLVPLGGISSVAYDVNALNQAVGHVVINNFLTVRGFRFTPPNQIEILPSWEIYADAPRAINDSGQIVGGCGIGPGLEHACLWEGNNLPIDLNPFSAPHSSAYGINNKGEIVGNYSQVLTPPGFGAFLRTGSQILDLHTLAGSPADWQFVVANDINEHSQIVGWGYHNGQPHAFLLTPTTMPGANVVATPADVTTGNTPVQLTFDQVTQGGVSTVTSSTSGPPPPAGFAAGSPAVYYDISTTVGFTGPVEVCIDATGIDFGGATPAVFHYESGTWIPLPTTFDVTNNLVCGTASSLSPFALFVPQVSSYSVNALYDQTRAARRGSTIPIKVQVLDATGANISSADLALTATRTVLVSTNTSDVVEDVGNTNPDGNFRFDASLGTGGGYIFNLSTSDLATGTYELEFTIGGSPVEYSVTFQVK